MCSNPRLALPAVTFPAFVASDFGVGLAHAHLYQSSGSGAHYARDNAAILSVGLDIGIDAELRVRLPSFYPCLLCVITIVITFLFKCAGFASSSASFVPGLRFNLSL